MIDTLIVWSIFISVYAAGMTICVMELRKQRQAYRDALARRPIGIIHHTAEDKHGFRAEGVFFKERSAQEISEILGAPLATHEEIFTGTDTDKKLDPGD